MRTDLPLSKSDVRRYDSRHIGTWEEAIGDNISRQHLGTFNSTFSGRMSVVGYRNKHMFKLKLSGLTGERTARHIASDTDERLHVLFINRGRTIFDYDGVQSVAEAGEGLIVPVGRPHKFIHPGPIQMIGLTVPAEDLRASGVEVDQALTRAMRLNTTGVAAPWIAQLLGTWQMARSRGSDALDAMMPYMLDPVAKLIATSPDRRGLAEGSERLFTAAITMILQECRDPDFGPDRLAYALHVSRRTLFRAFAAHNSSVGAELTRARIQRAERLLRASPQATVEFIAHSSGYRSMSSFYTQFQEAHSVSPRQFAIVTRHDPKGPTSPIAPRHPLTHTGCDD
ncbi:AraC family transcriptional regulator [Arthrobacter sp. KNU40]|uniref:AraC family transcriptional regulator n=1 Tax=Arthrobacter sp. KNU40 TaxID=3447965 RepID=UPI003F5DAFAE